MISFFAFFIFCLYIGTRIFVPKVEKKLVVAIIN